MRQKRQQRTGVSSSANSFRNLGGMPSGSEALSVFKEQSTWQTSQAEIMMGVGYVLALLFWRRSFGAAVLALNCFGAHYFGTCLF